MTRVCSFFVPGTPVPQPRARVTTRGKVARAYVPSGHPVHAWRQAIALVGQNAWRKPPLDQAIGADWWFWVPRPKSHYGTGKNAGKLKPSAPKHPTSRAHGDAKNLLTAAEDALEGILYRDDTLLCDSLPRKRYATPEQPAGVRVTLYTLETT